MKYQILLISLIICYYSISLSEEHGRIMEPPARNTMWRFGFATPPNYQDSELFCGGIKVQWQDNGGKCGICGDPFDRTRKHETGGAYAPNITTRIYPPGGTIDVVIELVANHLGKFQFHMCWRNSSDLIETEECFEKLRDIEGYEDFELKTHRRGIYIIPIKLPEDKTCSHCILRWHWKSANNWGSCENGTEAVGCGPQETYRNCADIAVSNELGIRGPLGSNGIEEEKKHWFYRKKFF